MAIKQQIPEAQGVQDSKVRDILTTMRTILNNITGRSGGQIQTLSSKANLGGVINKVNEIIYALQETVNPQSDIPVVTNKVPKVVTAIRSAGVQYTNDTSKIRRLSISYTCSVANGVQGLIVDGTTYYLSAADGATPAGGFMFDIYPGQTYQTATNSGVITIVTWVETELP